MIIYANFGGLEYLDKKISFPIRTSMGNMGFPKAVCSKTFIDWNSTSTASMIFECENTTKIKKIVSSGLTQYNNSDQILSICY